MNKTKLDMMWKKAFLANFQVVSR